MPLDIGDFTHGNFSLFHGTLKKGTLSNLELNVYEKVTRFQVVAVYFKMKTAAVYCFLVYKRNGSSYQMFNLSKRETL